MKNKIFKSMVLLSTLSFLLCAFGLCLVFYNQFSREARSELRGRANMLRGLTSEEAYNIKLSDMRVTLIDNNGKVLYDNEFSTDLPNHGGRSEVIEALATGTGESKRYSETLGRESYYCAVKLSDGNILRLSRTADSIWGIFGRVLTIVVCVVPLLTLPGYYFAGYLTRSIVEPINKIDPEAGASAPYDELAPFVRTISRQRARIDDQLADLKNRSDTIDALMNNMRDGIIIVNEHGRILSANKSALSIFDIDTDVYMHSVVEVVRDIKLIDHVHAALRGKSGGLEYPYAGRVYQAVFSPASGIGTIIMLFDVTERAGAEKLRREFTANVSHELKTPITTISGYAEMIGNGMARQEDVTGFAAKINSEAARLVALIEDIIMLSELDENDSPPMEEINISEVANSVAGDLSAKAAEMKVTLETDGKEVILRGNRSLLYETLYNLVDNGIKYNREGGSVTIRAVELGSNVEITVSDTGIGIAREDHDRIFERFYRVDKSRSKKTGGTGLGLSIAKHAVLVHGGKIGLKSAPDAGTSITVTLPKL